MYWLEWKFISLHLNHEDALLVGVPQVHWVVTLLIKNSKCQAFSRILQKSL